MPATLREWETTLADGYERESEITLGDDRRNRKATATSPAATAKKVEGPTEEEQKWFELLGDDRKHCSVTVKRSRVSEGTIQQDKEAVNEETEEEDEDATARSRTMKKEHLVRHRGQPARAKQKLAQRANRLRKRTGYNATTGTWDYVAEVKAEDEPSDEHCDQFKYKPDCENAHRACYWNEPPADIPSAYCDYNDWWEFGESGRMKGKGNTKIDEDVEGGAKRRRNDNDKDGKDTVTPQTLGWRTSWKGDSAEDPVAGSSPLAAKARSAPHSAHRLLPCRAEEELHELVWAELWQGLSERASDMPQFCLPARFAAPPKIPLGLATPLASTGEFLQLCV
jgi:hypothetical protein